MTSEQAIIVLDQATDPRKQGTFTRQDYVAIQRALEVLRELVEKHPSQQAGPDPAAAAP